MRCFLPSAATVWRPCRIVFGREPFLSPFLKRSMRSCCHRSSLLIGRHLDGSPTRTNLTTPIICNNRIAIQVRTLRVLTGGEPRKEPRRVFIIQLREAVEECGVATRLGCANPRCPRQTGRTGETYYLNRVGFNRQRCRKKGIRRRYVGRRL